MPRSSPEEAGGGSLRRTMSPATSSSPVRIRSRLDPLLVVCRCFSFLTAVVALACVFVNALSAYRNFKNGSDIFGGIFRCYAVVIALFVAVAETEWGLIFKFWSILEYWAGRGMLQIFINHSCGPTMDGFDPKFMQQTYIPISWELCSCPRTAFWITFHPCVAVMTRAFPDSGEAKYLTLLQEIASYTLMACGLTYIISGVLCIGFLKRARMRKEITRDQATKDLEELERRRQELEALLAEERA